MFIFIIDKIFFRKEGLVDGCYGLLYRIELDLTHKNFDIVFSLPRGFIPYRIMTVNPYVEVLVFFFFLFLKDHSIVLLRHRI